MSRKRGFDFKANGIELSVKQRAFVVEYIKDFKARRAAVAVGYSADSAYQLRDSDNISRAIDLVLSQRLDDNLIDAEWALWAAHDNYKIALQHGQISAANTALGLIMKHTLVDAIASDKLNMNVHDDREIMERLNRGRQRAIGQSESTVDTITPVSFL